MRAYLTEGEPIGDPAALARLALEVGLPADEVARRAAERPLRRGGARRRAHRRVARDHTPCRSSSSTAGSARPARSRRAVLGGAAARAWADRPAMPVVATGDDLRRRRLLSSGGGGAADEEPQPRARCSGRGASVRSRVRRIPETPDVCISHTAADRAWAAWIAWVLEAAGYSTVVDASDDLEERVAREATTTLAVVTPAFVRSRSWSGPTTLPPHRLVLVQVEPAGRRRARGSTRLTSSDWAKARHGGACSTRWRRWSRPDGRRPQPARGRCPHVRRSPDRERSGRPTRPPPRRAPGAAAATTSTSPVVPTASRSPSRRSNASCAPRRPAPSCVVATAESPCRRRRRSRSAARRRPGTARRRPRPGTGTRR